MMNHMKHYVHDSVEITSIATSIRGPVLGLHVDHSTITKPTLTRVAGGGGRNVEVTTPIINQLMITFMVSQQPCKNPPYFINQEDNYVYIAFAEQPFKYANAG